MTEPVSYTQDEAAAKINTLFQQVQQPDEGDGQKQQQDAAEDQETPQNNEEDGDEEHQADEDTPESTDDAGQSAASAAEDEGETGAGEIGEPAAEGEEELAGSLADIAAGNKVELDDLLDKVTHKIEVDGEEKELPLSEIVSSYRAASQVAQETEELEVERTDFRNRANQAREVFIGQATIIQKYLTDLDKGLDAVMETPEMMQMKTSDPVKYFSRLNEVNDQKKALQDNMKKLSDEYQEGLKNYDQHRINEAAVILSRDVKGWDQKMADETVGQFKELGFDETEIVKLWDARTVKAVREVFTLRAEVKALTAKAEAAAKAAKQVKKTVPKAMGPSGEKITPTSKANKKVIDLKKRLKEHDSLENAANVLDAIRKAG